MLSRNPKDYIIVTKETGIKYHGVGNKSQQVMVEEKFKDEFEGKQTTFWIVAKDGSYSRRYSIDSCPKWVSKVYNLIVE